MAKSKTTKKNHKLRLAKKERNELLKKIQKHPSKNPKIRRSTRLLNKTILTKDPEEIVKTVKPILGETGLPKKLRPLAKELEKQPKSRLRQSLSFADPAPNEHIKVTFQPPSNIVSPLKRDLRSSLDKIHQITPVQRERSPEPKSNLRRFEDQDGNIYTETLAIEDGVLAVANTKPQRPVGIIHTKPVEDPEGLREKYPDLPLFDEATTIQQEYSVNKRNYRHLPRGKQRKKRQTKDVRRQLFSAREAFKLSGEKVGKGEANLTHIQSKDSKGNDERRYNPKNNELPNVVPGTRGSNLGDEPFDYVIKSEAKSGKTVKVTAETYYSPKKVIPTKTVRTIKVQSIRISKITCHTKKDYPVRLQWGLNHAIVKTINQYTDNPFKGDASSTSNSDTCNAARQKPFSPLWKDFMQQRQKLTSSADGSSEEKEDEGMSMSMEMD